MLLCTDVVCLSLTAEPGLRNIVQEMLWEILELKKKEVTGGWKKPHTEGLSEFYVHSSLNIVREMKARRKCWVGHVVSIREKKFVPVSDVECSRIETISKTQAYSWIRG
jgi:hypothetical protein